MWNRKELKERARKLIRKNYWTVIVVCFLVALLTGEYGTSIIKIIKEEQDRKSTRLNSSHPK